VVLLFTDNTNKKKKKNDQRDRRLTW
jgi:hypothetical protein